VAVEGAGGAVSAEVKIAKGHYVMLRDQIKDLITLPTPAVAHIRNHDEPIEDYLGRRQDYLDGKTKGMPGASLGVAVRMERIIWMAKLRGCLEQALELQSEWNCFSLQLLVKV